MGAKHRRQSPPRVSLQASRTQFGKDAKFILEACQFFVVFVGALVYAQLSISGGVAESEANYVIQETVVYHTYIVKEERISHVSEVEPNCDREANMNDHHIEKMSDYKEEMANLTPPGPILVDSKVFSTAVPITMQMAPNNNQSEKQAELQTIDQNIADKLPISDYLGYIGILVGWFGILSMIIVAIFSGWRTGCLLLVLAQHAMRLWNHQKRHTVELLKKICSLKNYTGSRSETCQNQASWFEAAENGDLSSIKRMLKSENYDINLQRQTNGDTCLTIACRLGSLNIVEELLNRDKKRCDVNRKTTDGNCALTISAGSGHNKIVSRLLLCDGLELDNEKGQEAIKIAIKENFYEIADMIYNKLLESTVKVENTNLVHLKKAVILNRELKSNKLRQGTKARKVKELEQYKTLLLQNQQPKLTQDKPTPTATTNEELLSYGDCYICFDSMQCKRIFSCINDHWVCEDCLPEEKCPMCQVDLEKNPMRRCYTAEKIVACMQKL